MTVFYDDTYEKWERYVEPRWVHGSMVVPIYSGMPILHIIVSSGYIYGFIIESEDANDFKITWESNGKKYSIRISLPSPGTVHYSNVIPLNEGLPATGDVYISVTQEGSGKCRASILVSGVVSVEAILKSTPNWLVTGSYVAYMDPLYPLKSKVTWRTCVHEYGKGNILTGKLLWSYRLAENTWIASCCSADIDGDGNVEIIIPPGEYGRYVYCLNGKDGSVKWLYDTGHSNYWESTHITAYDIDMDGKMEVIVNAFGETAHGYGAKVHCIAHDGTVKWTYTPQNFGWLSVVPTCVYDIDDDGELEVITSNLSDSPDVAVKICIFRPDGTIKKSWEIPPPEGAPSGGVCVYNLAVVDIDKDGEAEIIAACSYSYLAYYYYYIMYILCFTRNGDIKWSISFPSERYSHEVPATIYDVDGDGNLEILIYHYCLDKDGKVKIVFDYGVNCIAYGVYDIDGDGIVECVGGDGSNMYCFNGSDGTLKWGYTTTEMWRAYVPGCLADLDSDGKYEVFFFDENVVIYCLEHDGTLKWYYAEECLYPYPLWKCALIDDVNGDGMLEAVAPVGALYKVYVFGSD
jgi:outer membrane protein assembly factor BamB